jgi:hypothetical protein
MVIQAIERELDKNELRQLKKSIADIEVQMDHCKSILGLNES